MARIKDTREDSNALTSVTVAETKVLEKANDRQQLKRIGFALPKRGHPE